MDGLAKVGVGVGTQEVLCLPLSLIIIPLSSLLPFSGVQFHNL